MTSHARAIRRGELPLLYKDTEVRETAILRLEFKPVLPGY
jgi:hypothetical protein